MKQYAKKPSEKLILQAIKGSRGIVSAVAKKLDCDWGSADKWIKSFQSCEQAMKFESETMLDIAENALFKNAQNGDNQAIKFYLATKGKKRGYVERTEVENTVTMNKPIEIKYNIIEDKED